MSTWPQWTMAGVYTFSAIYTIYRDGQKGEGIFGVVTTLWVYVWFVAVLYYGGFWSVWGFTP